MIFFLFKKLKNLFQYSHIIIQSTNIQICRYYIFIKEIYFKVWLFYDSKLF